MRVTRDQVLQDLRQALVDGPDPGPILAPSKPAWAVRWVRAGLVVGAVLLTSLGLQFGLDAVPGLQRWVWVLSALVLAVVPYRPLLAWRAAWVLLLLALLLYGSPVGLMYPGQGLAFALVLFAVGTAQRRGVLVWVWLATTALLGVGISGWPSQVQGRLVLAAGCAALLWAGYQVRRRFLSDEQLALAQERGTVLTERARIARELHDVVAHHMSMIGIRAETASYRIPQLPSSAQAEFTEIAQASREALTEMRRLLGVLRSGGPAPTTAPQPRLADLPELVAAARDAGAVVRWYVDADLPDLPAAVEVSGYRIVQEALTNAARHAAGAPVTVVVGVADQQLSLLIRNGPGDAEAAAPGPGHGLRGMRERTAMLGGELYAGPTGDGGFEVSAIFPAARQAASDAGVP